MVILESTLITVTVVQAKARLSELLDKVAGGEEIVITRHGRPAAHLSAAVVPRQPLHALATFRSAMPRWRTASARLLSEARDEER